MIESSKRAAHTLVEQDEGYVPTHAPNYQGLRAFVQECSSLLDAQDLRMELRSVADEERHGREVYVLVSGWGGEARWGQGEE